MKTTEDDTVYLHFLDQENLCPFHTSKTGASSFTLSSTALTMKNILLIMA